MEFLGDAVLGFVSAEHLFKKHPELPEGDLTRIRAALVCEESLHEVAQSLDLGNYLLLGKGEEQGGGRCRPSILADATESVFAAVYLDGGMDAASDLIHRVLLDKEREEVVEERRRDYKTELQELVQRRSGQVLHYELTGTSGPDHAKQFTFRVTLNGRELGQGTGRSKKEAEQSAARSAPEQLKKRRKKNTPARDGKGCWRYDAGCAQLDSKSHNSHQTKAEFLSPTAYKNRLKRYA